MHFLLQQQQMPLLSLIPWVAMVMSWLSLVLTMQLLLLLLGPAAATSATMDERNCIGAAIMADAVVVGLHPIMYP